LSGEAPFVNESGSSVLAANLDDSGFTARLGNRRSEAITRSVLESSTAAAIPGIAVGPTAARRAGLRDAEAPRFSTGMRGLCGLWLFLAQ
jgi:hypothetical protein